MNQTHHDLFNAEGYVLSQEHYEDFCAIRDKLMLMAQLAGTSTSIGDYNAMLFIRRGLLGRLFADLSFQMDEVLEVIASATTHGDRKQAL